MRAGTVLPPQTAARSLPRCGRLLRDRRTIGRDGHQYRDRSAVPGDDRGAAFLYRVEKLGQPVARFLCTLVLRGIYARSGADIDRSDISGNSREAG